MELTNLTKANIERDKKLIGHNSDPFYDRLNEFYEKLEKRTQECPDKKIKTENPLVTIVDCGKCCLEFFFYNDPSLRHIPAYKNGIWIKVYNKHGINIWILIVFSVNEIEDKAANVFSEINFPCQLLKYVKSFSLPDINPPHNFGKNGIWKSKDRVGARTSNDILQQICNWLPCLCNVKNTGSV